MYKQTVLLWGCRQFVRYAPPSSWGTGRTEERPLGNGDSALRRPGGELGTQVSLSQTHKITNSGQNKAAAWKTTCAPLHHTHKVQISFLCQPSIGYMLCIREDLQGQIQNFLELTSIKCNAPHACIQYIHTLYSSWVMATQRANRDMILAGNRCRHSLETGMMLCSDDMSSIRLKNRCKSFNLLAVQGTYQVRQTVCVKLSGTRVGAWVASWFSPSGWHSGNWHCKQSGKEGEHANIAASVRFAHLG